MSLGAYLGAMGERVLLVDCDPQANTTSGVGVTAREGGLYEVLTDGTVVTEAERPDHDPRRYLLPATANWPGPRSSCSTRTIAPACWRVP